MEAVLKYPLFRGEELEVAFPTGARILSASAVDGQVVIYAIADKKLEKTDTYTFFVYGTGVEFDTEVVTPDMFLGTVVLGHAVVHVFYKVAETKASEEVSEDSALESQQ